MILSTNRNNALLLTAMIACFAMIFIDESGIAVALPLIQQQLALTNNTAHWVINAYLLSLSVLLLLGGKLSDSYGQRTIFIVGVCIFVIASFICGCAPNAWILISGCLLQGLGASFATPCITILISRGFPENQFGKAFGLVLGFSNFFYAIGPFIGGAITEFLSWRWFFWINIPIGLVCVILTFLSVAKDTLTEQRHFSDFIGLFTFIIALTALIFAIMQGASWGWHNSWIMSLFVIAIVGLSVSVKIELQSKTPLLNMRLFENKIFSASNIVLFCASLCLTSMVFWALWLQASMGFSPATVGLALLPATIAFIFIPSISGAWQDKAGARGPMLCGALLVFIGILWITCVLSFEKYDGLLPGLLMFGLGIPLVIPSSITSIMTSVTREHSGTASGIFNTVRQAALTAGVAILSAILSSYNTTHLSEVLATSSNYHTVTVNQVNWLLVGKNTLSQLNPSQVNFLKQTGATIYTHALIQGMIVMTLIAAIASLVVLLYIKKR